MCQSTKTKKGVAKNYSFFPSLNFSKVNFCQRRTAITALYHIFHLAKNGIIIFGVSLPAPSLDERGCFFAI